MTDGFQRLKPQTYRPPSRPNAMPLPPRQGSPFASQATRPNPTGAVPSVTLSSSAPIQQTASKETPAPVVPVQEKDTIPKFNLELDNEPEKKQKKFRLTKKRVLIIGLIIAVIGGFAAGWYFFLRKEPAKVTQQTQNNSETVVVEEEKKIYSPLSGVETTEEKAARPVTAIMIENSPDARPQSGLDQAGVVYEAIAEGGITRFLTLFQENEPDYIGPVRSVRPYYLDWARPYDAPIAHVGGSRDALEEIRNLGLKDLDQFFNDDAYWRIEERFAPHNVYTSFEKLDVLNGEKGYTKSQFTGWNRKDDVPQTITARSIDITISGFLYNPNYEYDINTNSYLRSEGGEPHRDEKSGKQLSPKVVIAMAIPSRIIGASDGDRYEYDTVGSGKALVFQDGIVSEANWSKADEKSAIVFTDSNGLPFVFNRGQTWISVVDTIEDVEYTP